MDDDPLSLTLQCMIPMIAIVAISEGSYLIGGIVLVIWIICIAISEFFRWATAGTIPATSKDVVIHQWVMKDLPELPEEIEDWDDWANGTHTKGTGATVLHPDRDWRSEL